MGMLLLQVEALAGRRVVHAACGVWHSAAVAAEPLGGAGSPGSPDTSALSWQEGHAIALKLAAAYELLEQARAQACLALHATQGCLGAGGRARCAAWLVVRLDTWVADKLSTPPCQHGMHVHARDAFMIPELTLLVGVPGVLATSLRKFQRRYKQQAGLYTSAGVASEVREVPTTAYSGALQGAYLSCAGGRHTLYLGWRVWWARETRDAGRRGGAKVYKKPPPWVPRPWRPVGPPDTHQV